ncbi:spatacsin-like isoform X1 [Dreissena polymorpha]|uniref:Spatacsin C-terminal domain-containing protein n=1 Tax=Dreissena polymorpha TaxID=45954 RepID=A0A9D4HT93_DREPO|nr:spatacsin-like isoform X1 [Dreissena polymorpha]KAH3730075.1 hypothetical protein DPMN_056054 [Dreissena polymorpha]
MAVAMNFENQEMHCFRYDLHKLRTKLTTSNLKKFGLDLANCISTIHQTDGTLLLERICNRANQSNHWEIHHVQSFTTVNPENRASNESYDWCGFAVTSDHVFDTYTFEKDELKCFHLNIDILQLVKETLNDTKLQTVTVVHFTGNSLLLVVNNTHLIQLVKRDNVFHGVWSMALPPIGAESLRIVTDKVFILDSTAKSIFCRSLKDEADSFTVDLSQLEFDFISIQTWCISQQCNQVAFVLQNSDVILLDLHSFCTHFPPLYNQKSKTSTIHSGQRQTSFMQTSHYGDLPWMNKLQNLHTKFDTKEIKATTRKTFRGKHGERNKTVKMLKTSGFKSEVNKDHDLVAGKRWLTFLEAPSLVRGYSAEDMNLTEKTLSIVFAYNDVHCICCCSLDTEHKWTHVRLQPHELAVLSRQPNVPHLVLTQSHISTVFMDAAMNQEQFVSELMTYGGAALADAVCQLNAWGRCSLPMHTLEMALKHRQLDTVTYFLDSKQKYFSSNNSIAGNSPHEALQFGHMDSLIQLEPALHVLLQSARSTMGDKHSQIFGKQVLDVTMEFLYSLLLDGISVLEHADSEEMQRDIRQATDKVVEHIDSFRNCMRAMEESSRSAGQSESMSIASNSTTTSVPVLSRGDEVINGNALGHDVEDGEEVSEEIMSQFQLWNRMDTEMVIEDGIMKNKIPYLQQYLLQSEQSKRADFSDICSTGIALALNYIKHQRIDKAKELISKLGMNVTKQLWEMALQTLDMPVCIFITEELMKGGQLNEEQISMVNFLKDLNQLYPCRNFEEQKALHKHIKDCETRETHRLKALIQQDGRFDFVSTCENLSKEVLEEKGEPAPYNEVLLAWTQHWEPATREAIKLDVLLHRPGSQLDSFGPHIVWQYLLSRNMVDVIVAWIQNSFQGKQKQSYTDQGNHGHQNATIEAKWPVSHLQPLTKDFVNNTELCTMALRDTIRHAFARHGIFTTEAWSSFPIMLQEINKLGGPLQVPHPLARCDPKKIQEFHVAIVIHCIERNLHYFLWNYCSLHSLQLDFLYEVCENKSASWLPLFLAFYGITTAEGQVRKTMYESSLINASSIWGEDTSSVGELLKGDHPLAALATLMYSPHKLQQVTFITQQLEAFDGLSSETVERLIKSYPKLHVSLFPARGGSSPSSDVTVYELLQGNAPFDPSKLFGWQTTNNCRGEDASKEMPYFSLSALVASHGYEEQLRYNYYLKQGRPSFAFVTFLAEEFKNGGPAISNKRLAIAIGTSLWIGLRHFHNAQVATACVAFQELLGHDSLLLRTYIQAGNDILAYRHNAVTGTLEKRREQLKKNEQEVVELLQGCIQHGSSAATEAKLALEAAILASITKDRLHLCSFEAAERWALAVMFCGLLQLPYPTEFLETCAQTNQWLPFIWFAQLHQYPKEQLSNMLHKFRSHHLQEHLRYVLANADLRSSTTDSEKQVTTRQRSDFAGKEMRSGLYARIGIKPQESEESSSSDEDSGPDMVASDTGEDEDTGPVLNYESCPSDVFGVVFAAQTTSCPWKALLAYSITLRNSLFSELAISHQQQAPITLPCLCSWLVAMTDELDHEQVLEYHGWLPWRYDLHVLDCLIDLYVEKKWGSILVTAFDIFQQNSPLLPFLQFYSEFTEKQNFANCKTLLEEFKESVFQYHHEPTSDSGSQLVGDSRWLETTTYRIIRYMLTHTTSMALVHQLLKILDAESITLVFKNIDADFRQPCQLLGLILEGEVETVSLGRLLSEDSGQFESECKAVVDALKGKQMFDLARQFSVIAELPSDHVTIAQLENQKTKLCHTDLWSSGPARLQFYRECFQKCIEHKLALPTVAEYCKGECSSIMDPGEKSHVCEIAMNCLRSLRTTGDDHELVTELYREMWICRIEARVKKEQELPQSPFITEIFEEEDTSTLATSINMKSELLHYGKMPHKDSVPKDLTEQEVQVLETLVGELLDEGAIKESCKVTTIFSVYSQDLAILLSFIRLSLQTEGLDELTPDILHLLRTRPGDIHRQSIAAPVPLLRNASTISIMSNIQPVVDTMSSENEAKIAAMEILLNHSKHGRQTCVRILTAFKISVVLGCGYDQVIAGEDYQTLRSLLKTNCQARFRLAADFLATSTLSPEQVAGFLADAILQSYRVTLGDVKSGDQEMFFDPNDSTTDFHQVVRLCTDPSLLGNRLVEAVAAMALPLEDTSDKVLTIQTELLIRAHECYTAACDMEGISTILRASRILTSHLLAASEFQLMTRLLIGVGRYNEMTYIFDALQQSHQFELLLGKGMEKETKLKTAILDYLKRYHPGDTDTYTMVALKFMMYREIAQLLEQKANKRLDMFKSRPIENCDEDKSILEQTAQFLSEAAESYVKDSCLRHAQACIRKARLVALQIKYLSSRKQVLNLSRAGANALIAEHHVFTEAYIISEAYQQRECWPQALCKHVINRGDMKYLQEMRAHVRLTPQLIEDAVERYHQCTEKAPQAPGNVKKLLQYCKDVKVHHRLAKQLGLRDVIVELEKGDSKPYIMDFSRVS